MLPPLKLGWAAATFVSCASMNAVSRHMPRAWSLLSRIGNVTGRGGDREGAAGAAYFRAVADDYEVIAEHAGLVGSGDDLFRGRTVLEIGPGNSRAIGVLARLRGAASYEGLDAYDIQARSDAYLRTLYEPLMEQEGERGGFDRVRELLGGTVVHTSHEAVRRGGKRFDLIVSRAALEHVMDLEGLYALLREVATEDALMIHKVDMRSHGKELDDPLDFLLFPDVMYRLMSSNLADMPNRLRAPDYVSIGERHDFALAYAASTHLLPREQVERARPRLAHPYRRMPEDVLRVLGVWLAQVGPAHPLARRRDGLHAGAGELPPAPREKLSCY